MRRRGFTFIEIMLVTGIFAVLSLTIFTCLSNGLKLWERGRQMMTEEDAAIFFDRFSSDLRNSFSYSVQGFSGEESRLSFPTIVWTPADRVSVRADEGVVDQIGAVVYELDPEAGALVRRQANYGQSVAGTWGDPAAVVKAVRSVRFHYFVAGTRDPSTHFDPEDGVPSGVDVELTIMSGKNDKIFRRFIAVPAGV